MPQFIVIPAKAGIQGPHDVRWKRRGHDVRPPLDPRFRGDDSSSNNAGR